jgi:hypothetical protein
MRCGTFGIAQILQVALREREDLLDLIHREIVDRSDVAQLEH